MKLNKSALITSTMIGITAAFGLWVIYVLLAQTASSLQTEGLGTAYKSAILLLKCPFFGLGLSALNGVASGGGYYVGAIKRQKQREKASKQVQGLMDDFNKQEKGQSQ